MYTVVTIFIFISLQMSEAFSFRTLTAFQETFLSLEGLPNHLHRSLTVARYSVPSRQAYSNVSGVSSQHQPGPRASSKHLCSSHRRTSAKDPSTLTCFLVCGDSGCETHTGGAPAGGGDGPRSRAQYIPQQLGLGDRRVSCNGTGQW